MLKKKRSLSVLLNAVFKFFKANHRGDGKHTPPLPKCLIKLYKICVDISSFINLEPQKRRKHDGIFLHCVRGNHSIFLKIYIIQSLHYNIIIK